MPSVILRPNTTTNTGASITGAASEHAATSDNSDATYVVITGANPAFRVGLGTFTLPAGAVVSQLRVRARARHSTNPNPLRIGVEISGTSIHSQVHNLTPSFAEYINSYHVPSGGLSQSQIDALELEGYLETGGVGHVSEFYLDVDYAEQPFLPVVTFPSSTQTTTRKPLVDWTFNPGSGGGDQTKFQVKFFTAAQYGAGGFDPETSASALSSGTVTSSTSQWTPTSNLANGVTYRAYVKTATTTAGVDQWTGWSSIQFNIALALTAPTGLTPTNGSTVTSSKPALSASIATQPSSITVKREFQVASNTGFTTGVQTFLDTSFSTTKSGSITFPTAWTRLAQGTWYLRARTTDEDGQSSAWTSTNTFTVAHVPSTGSRTPSGAVSVGHTGNLVPVSWAFSDPDPEDVQTAYEVEHWLASSGMGTSVTTGKVVSSLKTANVNIAGFLNQEVRWRVRVWDFDDVVSAWSIDQAFVPRDLPVVNITAPVGAGGATTSQPTVTWTFSASGGRTQQSFRVVITDTDASQVVADSGVVASTATSWAVPTPVIVISTNYQVQLTIVDSSGLTNVDTDTFTASYVAPTTPTFVVQGLDFRSTGRVYIDWSSSTQDATCLGWNVYRRLAGETTWTKIFETSVPTLKLYDDYTAPANIDVEYSVTQIAESLGDAVESAYPIQPFNGFSDHYMLVVPEAPSLNLTLYHVTADSFNDEQEVAEINLIGRGRQVSYGTRFGQRGSLSGSFMDRTEMTARTQRLYLEAIRNSGLKTYLRNPFGDVWPVSLASSQISRVAGVGLRANSDYTIEYAEVTA